MAESSDPELDMVLNRCGPPASAFISELWRRDYDRVYRLTGRRASTLLSRTLT